jgi:hypothetical protein
LHLIVLDGLGRRLAGTGKVRPSEGLRQPSQLTSIFSHSGVFKICREKDSYALQFGKVLGTPYLYLVITMDSRLISVDTLNLVP